jgi:hypothetical protein
VGAEPEPAAAPPNNEVGAAVEAVVPAEVAVVAALGAAAGAAEAAGVLALFPKREDADGMAGA